MIGIDIVDMSRIILEPSFIEHILTKDEQSEFLMKKTDLQRKEYLAGRFAAKEAIYKASNDKYYLHYSILNNENGQPYVKDHPEINISISHDAGIAAAIALILPAHL